MPKDSYNNLIASLKGSLGEARVITETAKRFAYGTCAAYYHATPQMVVYANSESDIIKILSACRQHHVSLTFRGSGTSVCGQSITDSVLVLLRDGWRRCDIQDHGSSISLGVLNTGAEANKALHTYGRKIGPDPASIQIASIGGIVCNNSSGMTCGTAFNSWKTIKGIRIILTDGTVLDTRDGNSKQIFRDSHRDLLDRIAEVASRAKTNHGIKERILKKYRIKNTIGYSVNSLIDYEDPFDIIMHLMVGSEGTLAFVSEVTLATVDDPPEKATSLMAFEDAEVACEALLILKHHQVAAAEFMDRRTIAAVESLPGVPSFLKALGPEAVTLLVEVRARTNEELKDSTHALTQALNPLPKPVPIRFSFDPAECRRLWEIRGGFDAIIKAKGTPGTVMVGEDVAVPIEQLGPALRDFQGLFQRWGYGDAIIMGHALSGNCHFTLLQDFNSPENVTRFKGFVEDLVTIVVDKYDGSLKAEHGTGRCMAPFVEKEWGPEIFGLMKEIKSLFDPDGILNRGVVFTENANAHVSDLKAYSFVDPIIDACVECGYCEKECVSHGLTLSARQRVALSRYVTRLRHNGKDRNALQEMEKNLSYLMTDTCAACGRCAHACPSGINVGNYVKRLRAEQLGPVSKFIGNRLAGRVGAVTSIARGGLALSSIIFWLAEFILNVLSHSQRLGSGVFRKWAMLPLPAKSSAPAKGQSADFDNRRVVYFPSCINRMMGADPKTPDQEGLIQLVQKLCERAGYGITYCNNTENLCCGLAFASKGHEEAARRCERKLTDALLEVTDNGRIPVLCEMSSCLLHMKETLSKELKLYEPVEFTTRFLIPHLRFEKVPETVVVHPVCSTKDMGLEDMLLSLAARCAEKVVPTQTTCCGFAGDKGFTHPELNRHGLRHLSMQVPSDAKRGFSTNRTCEIGLSEASGIPFSSILYLVEECTRKE